MFHFLSVIHSESHSRTVEPGGMLNFADAHITLNAGVAIEDSRV